MTRSPFPLDWYRPHHPEGGAPDWPWPTLAIVYHRGRWYTDRAVVLGTRGRIPMADGELFGHVFAWTKSPCRVETYRDVQEWMRRNSAEVRAWVERLPAEARTALEVTTAGEIPVERAAAAP